ncbi:MAG: hypothetical protein RML93_04350 [Anaerolineales bacterium]|nr:hypothetical protein [Anaerolineales bacterium]MDW8446509.1 hypothetical protein [Anaerolineales bacterium]
MSGGFGLTPHGSLPRKALLGALATTEGLRLAGHVLIRNWGKPEDFVTLPGAQKLERVGGGAGDGCRALSCAPLTRPFLYGAGVVTGFKQRHSKAMPQDTQAYWLGNTVKACCPADSFLYPAFLQRMAANCSTEGLN